MTLELRLIHRISTKHYSASITQLIGFFQLILDEQYSLLTAFKTPYGRYKHERVPMDISAAPEIFQQAMQELFGDIEGCEIIFDDLLLHALNLLIHNRILRQVLQRAHENNVIFKRSKLELCLPEVDYIGHVLSDRR